MKRVLVAGIGNIFFGDDAFGCEVAAELARRELPDGITVRDFGIRGYDLAYAMMEDYDAIILIDASPRGEAPGTLYLIEPDIDKNKLDEGETGVVNAHGMSPIRVMQMVRHLGGQPKKLYVLGCEPDVLESEEGRMGLSDQVKAAVDPAVNMIKKLIFDLSGTESEALDVEKTKTKSSSERET
jgi:hydrogenase maturation protease